MSWIDIDRPPREKMYAEETEKVLEAIKNRGDQRIGQFILNLIRSVDDKDYYAEYDFDEAENIDEVNKKRDKALKEMRSSQFQRLWNIEADELAEIIEESEHH